MKYLIPALSLVFISSLSYAQEKLPAREIADRITHQIGVLKTCDMTRIWPGYTWENKFDSILLVSNDSKETYDLDYKNLMLKPSNYDKTPSFALGAFGLNNKVLSYSLDYTESDEFEVMSILVHENFHYFGQDKVGERESNGRGALFPYDATPRVYRAMVNYYLSEALKNPQKKDELLSKAKYWNELHKKEFNSDYEATGHLDRMEGSAFYAEVLTMSFALNNCAFNEETFNQMFFQGEDNIYSFYDNKQSDKDGQAYLGGMLAYMIDDVIYGGSLNLKKKSEGQLFPVEELLSSFSPIKTEPVSPIEVSIKADYEAANKEDKIYVDEFSERKNLGWALISKPLVLEGDSGGSFSTWGFIAIDETDYGFSQVTIKYTRKVSTPTITADLKGVNFYQFSNNACGENQQVFLVENTKITNNELIIETEEVDLIAKNFEKKDDIICIK